MAIPGPGPAISMTTLNTEFGGGFALSSYYRGGSFVPNTPVNAAIPTSGTIALGNFYGSQKNITVSLTATGNNYDVYTNRGPTYIAGISDVVVTVPGTVGSTTTGAYAMLVPSAFSPTDTVTIINNGTIIGAGGNGGAGGTIAPPSPPIRPGLAGAAGGYALYVNRPTTITNNGTIAGGGGGGGGGGLGYNNPGPLITLVAGGSGGGGGAGATTAGTGGAGASTPSPSANRIGGNPGSPGTSPAGGAGGPPNSRPSNTVGGAGGAGGGRGAAGAGGAAGTSPTHTYPGGAGGAAGFYLVGNPFVTWPATGTRQGSVS